MSDWTEYMKLLAGLVAITNPLGAIPVFLSITNSLELKDKYKVATSAAVATAVVLIFFSLVGTSILKFFSITPDSFRIAGGLLLLLMSLRMMGATAGVDPAQDVADKESLGIVPLALPLIAGPGAISTIIIYSEKSASMQHHLLVVGAILTVAALVYVALRGGIVGARFMSPVAVTVFNRIMGLIIASISVEFILGGIIGHFPSLQAG